MVDFKKTEQLYTKQGLVYQKKPHEIEYDRWYNSVTNPSETAEVLRDLCESGQGTEDQCP